MRFFACFALLFFLLSNSEATAQRTVRRGSTPQNTPKLEELPRRPMDTITTADPETKVIIFSNNTWEFYRPDLSRLDGLAVYQSHWDTASIFSYRNVDLQDLPQTVDLKLVDDMNEFVLPTHGKVTSGYGPRGRRNHHGIDVPLKPGEPILAAFDGKVRYAQYNTGGFGNLVIVRHPNGLETWYAHLSKRNVQVNDYVKAGQVIGYCGNTGRAYGASGGFHLHFETRYQDQSFDPQFLIDFENGKLRYQTFALNRSYFSIHSRASELLDEGDELDPNVGEGLLASADDSTLKRAAAPKPAPATTGPVYHTVRSGDILGRLAIRYGTTIDNICKLNKISRESTLSLGQRLRMK